MNKNENKKNISKNSTEICCEWDQTLFWEMKNFPEIRYITKLGN